MLQLVVLVCVASAMIPVWLASYHGFHESGDPFHRNIGEDQQSRDGSGPNGIESDALTGNNLEPISMLRRNERASADINENSQHNLLPHNVERSSETLPEVVSTTTAWPLFEDVPPSSSLPPGMVALINMLRGVIRLVPTTAQRMDRDTLSDLEEGSDNPVIQVIRQDTLSSNGDIPLVDSEVNLISQHPMTSSEVNNLPFTAGEQTRFVDVLIHRIRSQSHLAWLDEDRLRLEIQFMLGFLFVIARFPGVNERNLIPVLIATATHLMNTIGDPRVDTSRMNSIILAMNTYSLEERQSAEAIVNTAVSSGALDMENIAVRYLQYIRARGHVTGICNLGCNCSTPMGNVLLFSIPLPALLLIIGGILVGPNFVNLVSVCLCSIGFYAFETSLCAFCCGVGSVNEQ